MICCILYFNYAKTNTHLFLIELYFDIFRCDAKEFNFTKSHKKILKRLNNFLKTGQKCESGENSCYDESNCNASSSDSVNSDHDENDDNNKKDIEQSNDETSASAEIKMITSNPKKPIDIDNVLKLIEQVENVKTDSSINTNTESMAISALDTDATPKIKQNTDQSTDGNNNKTMMKIGIDVAKPVLKAKVLRQQRKAEKLLAKGISAIPTEFTIAKTSAKNTEKTLTSFINEMPTDGKHQLKVQYNII